MARWFCVRARVCVQIVTLENRLKYAEIDLGAALKKLTDNAKKLKAMEDELKKSKPTLDQHVKELEEKVGCGTGTMRSDCRWVEATIG